MEIVIENPSESQAGTTTVTAAAAAAAVAAVSALPSTSSSSSLSSSSAMVTNSTTTMASTINTASTTTTMATTTTTTVTSTITTTTTTLPTSSTGLVFHRQLHCAPPLVFAEQPPPGSLPNIDYYSMQRRSPRPLIPIDDQLDEVETMTPIRRVDKSGLLESPEMESLPCCRPYRFVSSEISVAGHAGTLPRRIDRSGLLEALPEIPNQRPYRDAESEGKKKTVVAGGGEVLQEPYGVFVIDRRPTDTDKATGQETAPSADAESPDSGVVAMMRSPSCDPSMRLSCTPSPSLHSSVPRVGHEAPPRHCGMLRRVENDHPVQWDQRRLRLCPAGTCLPMDPSLSPVFSVTNNDSASSASEKWSSGKFGTIAGCSSVSSSTNLTNENASKGWKKLGVGGESPIGGVSGAGGVGESSSPRSLARVHDGESSIEARSKVETVTEEDEEEEEEEAAAEGQEKDEGEPPQGERSEAEGCEHTVVEEGSRASFKASNSSKLFHNDNVQTLRVIILSEQL